MHVQHSLALTATGWSSLRVIKASWENNAKAFVCIPLSNCVMWRRSYYANTMVHKCDDAMLKFATCKEFRFACCSTVTLGLIIYASGS